MKRSLFIAALSTLAAGSTLAQSNVTIYGRLNETVEREKVAGNSRTVVNDNASRLGFKGSEDLGGGLKANFLIEHRFRPDTGTAAGDFWSGDSWVGLSSNYGDLRLGRMISTAYFATADYVSYHNHDTGSSSDALYNLGFQSWGNLNFGVGLYGKSLGLSRPFTACWPLARVTLRGCVDSGSAGRHDDGLARFPRSTRVGRPPSRASSWLI